MHCNTLQHTATQCNTDIIQACCFQWCNTLQHTATHCNTLQRRRHLCMLPWMLQHTATHCNALQHTATLYNTDVISACSHEWWKVSSRSPPLPPSPTHTEHICIINVYIYMYTDRHRWLVHEARRIDMCQDALIILTVEFWYTKTRLC